MSEAQEHITYDKKDKQTIRRVIALFVAVVVIGVTAFLHFYNYYIDGVLYKERLNQMQEVTSQLFAGLEDVISKQWNDVDIYCNYIELGKPQDTQMLLTFMKKQAVLNKMDLFGETLIGVDNLGRYITLAGWQGTLEEMDMLLDNPEKASFVTKSLTSDETSMCFIKRLPEPVTLQDNGRSVQIIYYGIVQNMTQLNSYFSCSAYDNSNSVYVLNEKGMRLFNSNHSNSLIEGYNAYTVLEQMDYLHGHSFEDAERDLTTNGYGYANAVFNGEEYYFALYQMEHAAWTLLFLVPSSMVATNVVSMVNTTIWMIMLFAVILILISGMEIFMILRLQQKKVMDAEHRNSERLAESLAIAERAEQEAREANRAKSEFLSNMSHDIRTPMNAIVGITKLMEHEENDPQKIDMYIHKVQASSQHLLSLINDVLDMSKIESSAVVLNTEAISIADQIAQIDSIMRPQTDERGQEFRICVHGIQHEFLIGDSVRLRQVFVNLLSNAVKYTPNGGSIHFEMEELPCKLQDHAMFRIAVTDTGYGKTPEFMEHIFEPFTRAENSTTNKVQGTGLGMAITKNIVTLMGGTISVQSTVDKGSCFTVELPFLINTDVNIAFPAEKILLISDEELLVDNIRVAFKATDAAVFVAKSEEEADRLLQQEKIDVLLLGGHLKEQRLADHLQHLGDKTKDALLFYCCAFEEQEQISDIKENGGVDGVLTRPVFVSNVAKAIERAYSKSSEGRDEAVSVLHGMHFLCAEDNELNAEILSAILDMNGASATIYPNGQKIVEAFALVKSGEYDAILMDVQMPVMNGLDATRAIRRSENPLGKTIPIIAMTANAFSEDVQNCLNAGMDAHVPKPLDINALERTLKSITNEKFSGGGQLSVHRRRL